MSSQRLPTSCTTRCRIIAAVSPRFGFHDAAGSGRGLGCRSATTSGATFALSRPLPSKRPKTNARLGTRARRTCPVVRPEGPRARAVQPQATVGLRNAAVNTRMISAAEPRAVIAAARTGQAAATAVDFFHRVAPDRRSVALRHPARTRPSRSEAARPAGCQRG